ncbi:MAG: DUF2786 domain-containing protein, partial [Verrucomicrobiaceae bacterium]
MNANREASHVAATQLRTGSSLHRHGRTASVTFSQSLPGRNRPARPVRSSKSRRSAPRHLDGHQAARDEDQYHSGGDSGGTAVVHRRFGGLACGWPAAELEASRPCERTQGCHPVPAVGRADPRDRPPGNAGYRRPRACRRGRRYSCQGRRGCSGCCGQVEGNRRRGHGASAQSVERHGGSICRHGLPCGRLSRTDHSSYGALPMDPTQFVKLLTLACHPDTPDSEAASAARKAAELLDRNSLSLQNIRFRSGDLRGLPPLVTTTALRTELEDAKRARDAAEADMARMRKEIERKDREIASLHATKRLSGGAGLTWEAFAVLAPARLGRNHGWRQKFIDQYGQELSLGVMKTWERKNAV